MVRKWQQIVESLTEKGLTIATMESCTGGGIANEITNIPGASDVLKESFVTYCNEAKIRRGVSAKVIEKYTVYSLETAKEMANAAKKQTGADYSIGVTGQLGRIDPNNPVEKLNDVFFAILGGNGRMVNGVIHVTNEERKIQKEFVIEKIADFLLEMIG